MQLSGFALRTALALTGLALALVTPGSAAPAASAALSRTCGSCHSLALVEAKRQSRSQWDQTLNKMQGYGAKLDNRAALLEELTRRYGVEPSGARGRTKSARIAGSRSRS